MSDTNLLTDEFLCTAQYLCLHEATISRLDQFPPGSGDYRAGEHHARRRRFEAAREIVKKGTVNVEELGLLSEDLKWAKEQANRAKDPADWANRFNSAYEQMLRLEEPQKS